MEGLSVKTFKQLAQEHEDYVKYIENKSPTYPKIYIEGRGSMEGGIQICLSTIVTFKYKGEDYQRHHIEWYEATADGESLNNRTVSMVALIQKLRAECYMTIRGATPREDEKPIAW